MKAESGSNFQIEKRGYNFFAFSYPPTPLVLLLIGKINHTSPLVILTRQWERGVCQSEGINPALWFIIS